MSSPHEVFQRFLDATRHAKLRRQAEQHGKRLEAALRKGFAAQGGLLVKKLRRVRSRFAEGFEGHAQFMNTPLRESLNPADWQAIWYEVSQETVKLFSSPIDAAVVKALALGALSAIGDVNMDINFDLANPRAVKYLDQHGAERVKGINATTLDDLRTLISQSADEGWSYTRTADAIASHFAEIGPKRADLIAMTEIGDAYSEGNLIVGQDLRDAGLEMEKSWSTSGVDPCEKICAPNEQAGWIPLDEAYPSGDQRPLGHPGCHCDQFIRRKGSE